MATRTLIDKIEALPPDKKAKVEEFVDSIAQGVAPEGPAFSPDLLDRIDARREGLLRERGLFPDSTQTIRELREDRS